MSLFSRKQEGGIIDTIRCDQRTYLIWKWHPKGSIQRQNYKENAIRWGSSLRVKAGEVALFAYKQNGGSSMDFIEGPFDGILKTANLPILTSIVGIAYDGQSPFQAEVYFINLAEIVQVKFAVPFFDVYDPRFNDYSVPVAVRGTLTFRIMDYKRFIMLHRLSVFTPQQFQIEIRDFLSGTIKGIVANVPYSCNIPVIQIERSITAITETVANSVYPRLESQFGVKPTSIDISAVEIDKTSDGYRQLMQVTQDISTATIQAQSQANIQSIHDIQQINMEHTRESLRIEREERQYAKHIQTQSENLETHQLNQQVTVGIAGAQALGQMGANGATTINGNSMNMAGIMTSMAMGGVIGQNMASMMGNMMNTINQPNSTVAPPPINTTAFHVAINGAATGPYTIQELSHMASLHQIDATSLVWKPGMSEWATASTIPELYSLFDRTMPPIPPQ